VQVSVWRTSHEGRPSGAPSVNTGPSGLAGCSSETTVALRTGGVTIAALGEANKAAMQDRAGLDPEMVPRARTFPESVVDSGPSELYEVPECAEAR
jgi:hypothetical protein